MEPVQRKITRTRDLRACTECRRRKLKCDRQVPCSSCARRNEAAACAYEKVLTGYHGEHERRLRAETRLAHLEQLVQQLSGARGASALPLASDVVQRDGGGESQTSGTVSLSNIPDGTLYNGSTHWSAMLEDIEELRYDLGEQEDLGSADLGLEIDDDNGIGLLYGATKSLLFQDVLAEFLPSRRDTDRLFATYFRTKAVAAPFVHPAQFYRLYQIFWADPFTSPPLWASMLFSILDIASRTLSTGSASKPDESRSDSRFAMAAAHCLAAGEYHKPKPFAVEGLLLYAQARCLTSLDLSPDVALVFGTLVRLATLLGYHRDADVVQKGLSAFEGEMRRRVWSVCMQLDVLVSFQLGLPSNVQFPTWDTRPPTNLLDSDFDELTAVLPPSRPDSEPTELLFYLAKHRLFAVFEKIVRHTLAAGGSSEDELAAIDQELRATYAAVPMIFQARSMSNSIVDPPSVIVTRLCVEFIYQKCLCVLHRKYVTRGNEVSVQTCYYAASEMVRRFVDIYVEFRPGGQLETERWFLTSITWHDFLLGCMTLCLVVCSTRQDPSVQGGGTNIVNVVGSLELLRKATALCDEQSHLSRDTRKVRRVVEATIVHFSYRDSRVTATLGPMRMQQELNRAQERPAFMIDETWGTDTSVTDRVIDPAWLYLEQFLNLPEEDFRADG